jgi:predicted PurR-regulated permease PerM
MVCLWVLLNHNQALEILSLVIGILMPLIIGLCMAFILNVPMRAIEIRLLIHVDKRFTPGGRGAKIWGALKRPLSLLVTLVLVFGIITLVIAMLIPELRSSITLIINRAPGFFRQAKDDISEFVTALGLSADLNSLLADNWRTIVSHIWSFLSGTGSQIAGAAMNIAGSVFSGLANGVLGFVFALYILASKEKLGRQAKSFVLAYLNRRRAKQILSFCALTSEVFNRFIAGQCIEGVIIGTMAGLGSLLINPSYALMLGVTIGFTALVPVVGAFAGILLGAFLLLMESPLQALAFIIFIVILQQIESNVIYPRVVGSSIGLPGIWVLLSVIVGGSLYGIPGIIIGVPLAAALYAMLGRSVRKRLRAKKIDSGPGSIN